MVSGGFEVHFIILIEPLETLGEIVKIKLSRSGIKPLLFNSSKGNNMGI